MRNLMRRVNARVGTASGSDGVGARLQFRQRSLYRALNGRLVGLPLPSGKRRTMVFDLKSITGHVSPISRCGMDFNAARTLPMAGIPTYLSGRAETERPLPLNSIVNGITRTIETATDVVTSPFSEPVIRLGVTGLSRAGKTVFITSLVANLMDRGRMPQFVPAANGAILSAYLQPQPDDTVPRFPFEDHLSKITSKTPSWPEGTRRTSELRLSLRVRSSGLLSGVSGPRTVHLDIVDYPGEWLLDLALLEKTYEQWSAETLDRMNYRKSADGFRNTLDQFDATAEFQETALGALSAAFADYLEAARQEGYSDLTPGRFLLPGDLEGSPVLTFAPLPDDAPQGRGTYWRECERRFEAYKKQVVKPFFQEHFARIDRQIVLVDVLGAIHNGPRAVEDLRTAMADILSAFRPGRNAWLSRILGGKRVEKILFAATKADHLHHSQHAKLTAITAALLRDAKDRADFAGAETQAMSIAALRATTEDTVVHDGTELNVVRGTLENGRQAAFYPGALPDDPAHLLGPARDRAEQWLDEDYGIMNFSPAPLTLKAGDGPPHIRLDRAAQFLFGDRL